MWTLLNNDGIAAVIATPIGGRLGVFTGPDPDRDILIGIDVPLFGSTVEEFSLNPVSVNNAGDIAIRVKVADGRQFIVRARATTG